MQLTTGLISGCLIWIPISIGTISLIGWMIQGEVDVLAGLFGIALALVIGGLALVSKDQQMAPFLFAASVSILVLFPVARAQHEKRETAKIDLELLEKAYGALGENPQNVFFRVKIAKILYDRGIRDQAVSLAENALRGAPKDVFEAELRMLRTWKRAPMAQPPPNITCVACGARNKPGEPFCYRCGAPVLLHYAKGHWVHPTLFRRILLIWIAAAVPILGIPLAGINLSPNESPILVVLLLGFSAFMCWFALRKPPGSLA